MIRCMIIDDEPWAIDLLKSYIAEVPFLELLYASENPVEALNHLRKETVDLIFLDIQMPRMTGIRFMEVLEQKSRVIVTTAYSEYALLGYEHNIVDYLLKPIEFSRFYKAVQKVYELPAPALNVPPVPARAYLFIKTDGKLVKVAFTEILFVEALKDYISVCTTKGKLISLDSLINMEKLLPAHLFIRVHKSFIVSLEKIETVERNRIFIGEHVLPIGDLYKEKFMQMIGKS
jgi:DNA-binding LytR/AlgR family response regulator